MAHLRAKKIIIYKQPLQSFCCKSVATTGHIVTLWLLFTVWLLWLLVILSHCDQYEHWHNVTLWLLVRLSHCEHCHIVTLWLLFTVWLLWLLVILSHCDQYEHWALTQCDTVTTGHSKQHTENIAGIDTHIVDIHIHHPSCPSVRDRSDHS